MYVKRTDYPLNSTLQAIPDGKEGTVATLKIMRQLVKAAKTALPIRELAVSLTNGKRSKDWFGEVEAIHAFVQNKVRYVRDVAGVETVQTPEATLKMGAGDCDDKSVLAAALLESIGHPTRFVAVGFKPDDFVHVYPETRIGTSWVSVETTEPVSVGWQPENIVSRLTIHN